jgi:hypothetical protein
LNNNAVKNKAVWLTLTPIPNLVSSPTVNSASQGGGL